MGSVFHALSGDARLEWESEGNRRGSRARINHKRNTANGLVAAAVANAATIPRRRNYCRASRTRYITHFPRNFLPPRVPRQHNFLRGSVAGDVEQLEMRPAEGNDYSGTRRCPITRPTRLPSGNEQLLFVLSFAAHQERWSEMRAWCAISMTFQSHAIFVIPYERSSRYSREYAILSRCFMFVCYC